MEYSDDVPSLLKDEDEIEAESDPLKAHVNLSEQLEHFREKWQQELRLERQRADNGQGPLPTRDRKEEAQQYFLMGARLEQEGSFYEAIEFYRMAMQLVPDIEYQMNNVWERSARVRMESESSVEESVDLDDDELDLMVKFENLRIQDKALCQPAVPQRMCHISQLPAEVLNYIFKWVVSSQLDMKSLENLSEVCRGFYLCARDEELWRLACVRIWNAGTGKVKKFGTWRNMYIERPHLRFTGCYIAATSYIRQGEKGLDNFYRPWHCVEYYRYVRFFTEGILLMMTSPEEPLQTLPKLKSRHSKAQGILRGYYRLSGDKVTGVLKRVKPPETKSYSKYKRNRNQVMNVTECEQTFHVEFTISNVGKKNGWKLIWNQYSVKNVYKHSGEEYLDNFELKNDTYPPLIFSRVKSFTSEVEQPLQ